MGWKWLERIAGRWGAETEVPENLAARAAARAACGDLAGAEALRREALAAAERFAGTLDAYLLPFLLELGEAQIALGRTEDAGRYLGRARAIARDRGLGPHRVEVERAMARLRMAEGDPGGAVGHLEAALEAAAYLGDDPWLVPVLLDLASAADGAAEPDRARAARRRAVEIAGRALPGRDAPAGAGGGPYREAGLPPDADPLAREAVALAARLTPEHAKVVGHLVGRIAEALVAGGRRAEARVVLDRLVEAWERIGEAPADTGAWSLETAAWLRYREDDLEGAEALYRRALALREDAGQGGDLASTLETLAWVCLRRGATGEALALSERALPLVEEALGERHPAVPRRLAHVGWLRHRLGIHAGAAAAFERAAALWEDMGGAAGAELASALHGVAASRHLLGDHARAEATYLRALELLARPEAADATLTARCERDLGLALAARGRLAEAEEVVRRAVERTPDGGPERTAALMTLAHVLLERGDAAAAAAAADEALALARAALDPAPAPPRLADDGDDEEPAGLRPALRREDLIAALGMRGAVARVRGELAAAEAWVREAVAMAEAPGVGAREAARAHEGLAELLVRTGRAGEARPVLDRARALRGAPGRTAAGDEGADALLAWAHRAAGDAARAEPLARGALEAAEGSSAPDALHLVPFLRVLGEVRADLGDLEAAEALLARAQALADAAVPAGPALLDALEARAAARRRAGREDEAADLEARAAAIRAAHRADGATPAT